MNYLFDLDGTLVDSRDGIVDTLIESLHLSGVSNVSADELTFLIGDPLSKVFERYLSTEEPDTIEKAISDYRRIYTAGNMYRYSVFPGITEMLERLASEGHKLFVATAKVQKFAVAALRSGPFAQYLTYVYGSGLDGTNARKGDLIKHVIMDAGLDKKETIMVGDRHHDVRGARENQVGAVGVLYGYGSEGELEEAHALVGVPGDLYEMLATMQKSRLWVP